MTRYDSHSPDPLLVLLANVVDAHQGAGDISVGLTIHVGGSIISGLLIPQSQWLTGVANVVGSATTGTSDDLDTAFEMWSAVARKQVSEWQTTRAAIDGHGDQFAEKYRQGVQERRDDPFISMAEAKFWSLADRPAIPSYGTYWRGRVSCVDGWSMGVLSQTDATEIGTGRE